MAAPTRTLDAFPLFAPPPRRYRGPIVDAHMHSRDEETIASYWDVAEKIYGVRCCVPIVDLKTAIRLKQRYGGRVQPAVWGIHPRNEDFRNGPGFRRHKEAHLDALAEAGMKIVKLWFTPRFLDWWNLRMDDPTLDFFFDRIERLGLAVLVHVADPDAWFARQLRDMEQHGAKPEHYPQLIHRLERHPGIIFQVAHFAADPENLEHLHQLLERHPNLVLDSSATKWISREFSRHGPAARDFLIEHADRVLFGTDLVASPDREKEGKREHYATRFYVHQMMWEAEGVFDSPIEDEDATEPPRFCGLNLPADVLQRFYWENAARLYGFTADESAATR
ncbi:MAG: amidohydrolase [Gemmatales bacterium]|nr:amidohydrolase [Gemmatales bacterium]MDW8386474.1 amidohydrolase family protein [Gemmatales bacterium]